MSLSESSKITEEESEALQQALHYSKRAGVDLILVMRLLPLFKPMEPEEKVRHERYLAHLQELSKVKQSSK